MARLETKKLTIHGLGAKWARLEWLLELLLAVKIFDLPAPQSTVN
jgi:hypothetical protein